MGNKAPSPVSSPKETRCKILLVGDHGVGKSKLVKKYKQLAEGSSDDVEEEDGQATCSLIGIDETLNGSKLKVLCMDSLNEEDFKLECRMKSIRNANLCMLVMDISEPISFQKVPAFLDALIQNDYGKTLILVGTKGDICTSANQIVKEFMEQPQLVPIEFYVVSAETGEGVVELFHRAIELGMAGICSRWSKYRGLLYVYSFSHDEPNSERGGIFLGNICEAIPQLLQRRKKKRAFPLRKLNSKLLQLTAEFL